MKTLKILLVLGIILSFPLNTSIKLNTGTCLTTAACLTTATQIYVSTQNKDYTDPLPIFLSLATPSLLLYYANSPIAPVGDLKHVAGTVVGLVQLVGWALFTKMLLEEICLKTKPDQKKSKYQTLKPAEQTQHLSLTAWTLSMALCSAATIVYANQSLYYS